MMTTQKYKHDNISKCFTVLLFILYQLYSIFFYKCNNVVSIHPVAYLGISEYGQHMFCRLPHKNKKTHYYYYNLFLEFLYNINLSTIIVHYMKYILHVLRAP